MKKLEEFLAEAPSKLSQSAFPGAARFLSRNFGGKKYKAAAKMYLDLLKKQKKIPKSDDEKHSIGVKAAKIMGVDFRNFEKVFHQLVKKGDIPMSLGWLSEDVINTLEPLIEGYEKPKYIPYKQFKNLIPSFEKTIKKVAGRDARKILEVGKDTNISLYIDTDDTIDKSKMKKWVAETSKQLGWNWVVSTVGDEEDGLLTYFIVRGKREIRESASVKEFIKESEQLNEDFGAAFAYIAGYVIGGAGVVAFNHYMPKIKKALNNTDKKLLSKIQKLMSKNPELDKAIRSGTGLGGFKRGHKGNVRELLYQALIDDGADVVQVARQIDDLMKKISDHAHKAAKEKLKADAQAKRNQ